VEIALEARNRQEDYMKKTFVNQRSTEIREALTMVIGRWQFSFLDNWAQTCYKKSTCLPANGRTETREGRAGRV
jgi:hypothetical protein